jgi:hypothetical protein
MFGRAGGAKLQDLKIAAMDVRQHAGIACREEAVRSLEFRRLERGNTADVARRVSASQNETARVQQIVEASASGRRSSPGAARLLARPPRPGVLSIKFNL